MNIHVRLAVTEGEFPYLIQLSTDNLVWVPIKAFKELDPAMIAARQFEDQLKEAWKIKVNHVLWRTKT